jgi:hypothetical protein
MINNIYFLLYEENTAIKIWYIHSKRTETLDQESTDPPSKFVSSTYFIC